MILDFFSKYVPTPHGSIVLKHLEIKYKTVECTEKDIKRIPECWQDCLLVSKVHSRKGLIHIPHYEFILSS